MKLVESVKASWQTLVVLLTPIALCPLVFPYSDTSLESRCAGLMVLMAVFWITESLPLPLTSLLPIALCPLLGIASSKRMCAVYFGETTFLILGGFIVAIAIEECQLHKRLALKILVIIGVEPRRLMLGVMLVTAFLSMWISNTATAAMMLTITRALMLKLLTAYKVTQRRLRQDTVADQGILTKELESATGGSLHNIPSYVMLSCDLTEHPEAFHPPTCTTVTNVETAGVCVDVQLRHRHEDGHKAEVPLQNPDSGITEEDINEDEDGEGIFKDLDPQSQDLIKMFGLCVCYSANIGGMATLIGTMPNIVLSSMAAEMSKTSLVTFTNWLALSLPVTVLILAGAYLWMCILVFGFRNTVTCRAVISDQELKLITETVEEEYRRLGDVRFNEVIVLVHFLILVVLWLTRDLGSVPGWSSIFQNGFVSDGSAAIAVATSLFIFPNHRPNVLFFRRKGDDSQSSCAPSILNWKQTCRKLPWGVLFLTGGGIALTEAAKVSGLSKVIASNLSFIQHLPVWVAGLVVTTVTSLVTEVTSNTVVVLLLLPILRDIAVTLAMNPMYLMLPATLASSLAFMLPVATPPNALVFSYGDLKSMDMIKAGAVLNVIGILVIVLAINTWGFAIYDLGTFPAWAVPVDLAGKTIVFAVNTTMSSNNYTTFAK